MGFLDFLFGKTIRIEHNFFGTMTFRKNKKEPIRSLLSGSCPFSPSGKEIDFILDADETGPTQLQVDFFKSIENSFAAISESIVPLIEDEFRNWKDDFAIEDFSKEFQPVFIQLPRCETLPVIWEIAFESEHDLNHQFTVTMKDLTAESILIDG